MTEQANEPAWVDWGRRLQAVAQNGLEFARDEYDRARYRQVRAIAAELLGLAGGAEPAAVEGLFERQEGYATPKVDVRGAVFHEGKVLLVREGGRWTLPGGWADVEDSPRQAVEREVREESGYRARATKLVSVWDRAKHPHTPPRPWRIYKLFFLCELACETRGAIETPETDAAEWFARGEIGSAPLDLARVTPWQIERLFAHAADPALPPEFD